MGFFSNLFRRNADRKPAEAAEVVEGPSSSFAKNSSPHPIVNEHTLALTHPNAEMLANAVPVETPLSDSLLPVAQVSPVLLHAATVQNEAENTRDLSLDLALSAQLQIDETEIPAADRTTLLSALADVIHQLVARGSIDEPPTSNVYVISEGNGTVDYQEITQPTNISSAPNEIAHEAGVQIASYPMVDGQFIGIVVNPTAKTDTPGQNENEKFESFHIDRNSHLQLMVIGNQLSTADRKDSFLSLACLLHQLAARRSIAEIIDSKIQIKNEGEGIPNSIEIRVLNESERVSLSSRTALADTFSELRINTLTQALEQSTTDMRALEKEVREAREMLKVANHDLSQRFSTQQQVKEIGLQLELCKKQLVAAEARQIDQKALWARVDAAEIANGYLKKGLSSDGWNPHDQLKEQEEEIKTLKETICSQEQQIKDYGKAVRQKNLGTQELERQLIQMSGNESAQKSTIYRLQKEVEILKDKLDRETDLSRDFLVLQRRTDALGESNRVLKQKLDIAENFASQRNSLDTNVSKESAIGKFDSFFGGKIFAWMLEDASPESLAVDNGYLSLCGKGPWDKSVFRQNMKSMNFSLWPLADQDVMHVVVGREGWDGDLLVEQIEACEGGDLRIYSQEMWVAKLITGRDPFDSEDDELLMAFAKGHAALEYLMSLECAWPDVTSKDQIGGNGEVIEPTDLSSQSPLNIFGYQVGASSGYSVQQRQDILARFLNARNIAFDEKSNDDYKLSWGKPRSIQRLYRMAVHIKWLIEWQGRDPRRTHAYEDWREDLAWLKKTYYRPRSMKFKWPNF